MQLFKRIITAGLNGFYRNRTISISSIFILVVTLSIIASIFLFKAVFNNSVDQIKSKVDISIYLKSDSSDATIISVKQKLSGIKNVKEVNFISKEDTLKNFKEQYKNDAATIKALEEIGTNPFGASYQVKANDTNDYDGIMSKINEEGFLADDKKDIDKINYVDIKDSIDKLNKIIIWFNSFGLVMIIIFAVMSLLIVYNTVRLAIFTFKDEISVMKLVGASDMYIRGPFIVESIIYGLLASIITVLLFYPVTKYIATRTMDFFGGYDVHLYYTDHLVSLFLMLAGAGILVASISSILAVRKYLSV
jgi:cell division transport system permease protein